MLQCKARLMSQEESPKHKGLILLMLIIPSMARVSLHVALLSGPNLK